MMEWTYEDLDLFKVRLLLFYGPRVDARDLPTIHNYPNDVIVTGFVTRALGGFGPHH